eukprot:scaffold1368_cov138-Alexandrium_tamarense.AAC.5
MIVALLGEDAVRNGPPVLQAARTRTTSNIRRDTQGDTKMQDAPPEDGAAGQGPPDAGQPNPGGGSGGGGSGGGGTNRP